MAHLAKSATPSHCGWWNFLFTLFRKVLQSNYYLAEIGSHMMENLQPWSKVWYSLMVTDPEIDALFQAFNPLGNFPFSLRFLFASENFFTSSTKKIALAHTQTLDCGWFSRSDLTNSVVYHLTFGFSLSWFWWEARGGTYTPSTRRLAVPLHSKGPKFDWIHWKSNFTSAFIRTHDSHKAALHFSPLKVREFRLEPNPWVDFLRGKCRSIHFWAVYFKVLRSF